MKPLLYIFSGLFLGMVLTETLDQPVSASATDVPVGIPDVWLKPGAVMGVHRMVLKDGVDRDEAERFLKEEYFPGWRDAMPRSRVFMLEGERGVNAGSFAFLWIFEDLAARNSYFPGHNEPSEKYATLRSTLDPLYAEDKFPKYAAWADEPVTDYMIVQ